MDDLLDYNSDYSAFAMDASLISDREIKAIAEVISQNVSEDIERQLDAALKSSN